MKNPKNYTEEDWNKLITIAIWSNIIYWAFRYFI